MLGRRCLERLERLGVEPRRRRGGRVFCGRQSATSTAGSLMTLLHLLEERRRILVGQHADVERRLRLRRDHVER